MKHRKITKRILALLLALLLSASYIASAVGQSYAIAHPASVNEGKTDAEIEADDLEQFSARSGYDYHEAGEDDYAPHELILEVLSSPSAASASIRAFEDAFDLQVERVLSTTELEEESAASLASLDAGDALITTYFMRTGEDDIISLCDTLNAREDVFYAQPNFKYDICEAENPVDLSAPAQAEDTAAPEPAQGETAAPEEAAEAVPGQEAAPPQEPEADAPVQAESYTAPPAFSTTGYTSNLKWWFDYCQISSAWESYADTSTGYGMGKGVKVAVIDTGCNTAHEDIVDNLWVGPQGQCGYYAYGSKNISINDSTMDTNGHGSHCCGTIAMSGDNTVGGIGTAPKCSLMVMKADRNDGKGTFYSSEVITSLNKAKEYGADIISMSLGGYNFDYTTYRTYQSVSSSCLIVCAAGNHHFDTSEKLHFPSAASCVIGVMALADSSYKDKLATFTNYDTSGNFYKVAAPGTSIYSLDYTGNNKYRMMQGTSMATPAAAGMIASFMSYIKYVKGWDWTPAQYQYEVEYLMNYSGNTISCSAYSQSYHPVAYNKGATFKVMNLKYLFSRMATLSNSPFASTSVVGFNNTTIRDGVVNATGLSANELDSYALRRVSLLYWGSESTRKGISDYSDLTKLTGLNYLDLSGSSKITSANVADVIAKCPATIVHLNLNTTAKLGDLPCLASAKFSNLHYLNISSNNITTLSPIEKFTSLKYLYANSNAIVDISALSGMTHIEKIELNNNQIEDPNPAFASDFLNYVDLSHNKIVDHTQLLNYKGAYHSSELYSEKIDFYVDYNNMTSLTTAVANNIISAITSNNTKGGKLYATTINFTYTNQTAPVSTTPMTSFKLEDKTVSREVLCSGNLNLNAITGFTAYPSGANQYNYLTWSCSEGGYFASDGTVLVSPEEITSCRTLTLTGTAPAASGAKSTVTGTASQTIKLTITAPEIQNAYLSDRVIKTGSNAGIIVSTNQYTDRVYMRFSKSGAEDITIYGNMPETAVASGGSKITLFVLPTSVIGTAGNYSCYVYPADSAGNYGTAGNQDVSGKSTYPYKYLGYLYVKDSVTAATDTINVTYDTKVNRYGQAALFAVNSGTTSSSPAKPSGNYGLSTYTGQKKYIGQGSYFSAYGAGYFGNTATGYPSAQTGEASFFLSNSDHSEIDVESVITTIAPEVKAVEVRNATTYKTDGYAEYLVKTNTAATTVKAYKNGTTEDICSDLNHVTTTFNSTGGSYANYNATYSYKLWSVKVPLTAAKAMQPITLVAADPLGDTDVTKTPATGLKFSSPQYIYPGENNYKVFGNYLTVLPADDAGNSLADCCKSVTYSVTNGDYFSVYSNYNGRINVDTKKVLEDLEDTATQYKTAVVTATLENGAKANATLYAYRPIAKNLQYDTEQSSLTNGGTVYYTVKTYGSDTIYVRDTNDKYSEPLYTFTLADTDHYTTEVDEAGNTCTLWHFTRTFGKGVTTLRTYVRSSYDYSADFTSNSATYTSLAVTRSLEPGDYSQWEAEKARMTSELLSALEQSYGTQSALYAQRLAAYNEFIDNAVLTYNETQQEEIDAQTQALKALADELLAYGDYAASLEAYEQLCESAAATYISDALTALISTPVTDSNRKAVSLAIDAEIARIQALAAKIAEVEQYITDLGSTIPELKGDTVPMRYSAESYSALKAQYDLVKSGLTAGSYADIESLESDYLALQEARAALHEHHYTATVTAPTCTEQGYTTYACDGCDARYITDFTAALGHSWGAWETTTPATFLREGEETRICARDASHKETRAIPATGELQHTNLGDATDFTFDVSLADASAGKYAGCIDVAFKIAIDYSKLKNDGARVLKIFNQIITIDPSVVSTVSKASKTRGTPNMQEMIALAQSDSLHFINATKDWAVSATPIPRFADAEDTEDFDTFQIGVMTTLAYNENTGKVLIQLSGYNEIGYLNEDGLDKPEFTVLHLYLKPQEGKSLVDAKNAIAFAQGTDLEDSATPSVMDALSYVSGMYEAAGTVDNIRFQYSLDFYPKYDITFHWFSDGGTENTTVQPTTEGILPEGFTPADYQKGDYAYTFSGWDRELAPATENTDYTAQYSATFLGHDYVPEVTKAPSCTEPGITTYTCSRCGESYDEPIPATGHTPGAAVEENRIAAGCETPGSYDAVVYCTVCNSELSRQAQTITALGHSWGAWERTTEPTCTQQGEDTCTCTRDTSHKQTRAVDALGHDYHPVITAPTCTEQGYTTYTCSRCTDSYIADYTPAAGHMPGAEVQENKVNAACEAPGSYDAVIYCTVCGSELSRQAKTIAALGHSWGAWERTTEPTCTQQGEDTRTCTRDASHKQTRAVDMLPHTYLLHDKYPIDKVDGSLYFTCEVCEHIFRGSFNGTQYVAAGEEQSVGAAQAAAPLPAPYFNIFTTEDYAYEIRGASLRVSESAAYDKDFDTTQGMRFTASMQIPDGVSYEIGGEGNCITDIGFVYSQDSRIGHNIDNLVLGAKDVYSMSVKAKNSGTFNGENWSGLTYHEENNTFTYNIVINVKAQNWERDYCARAYVTYHYNGYDFTVYDSEYAYRNVADLARQVVASESETEAAKDFCRHKILENI